VSVRRRSIEEYFKNDFRNLKGIELGKMPNSILKSKEE
jgi:hypothetical protein